MRYANCVMARGRSPAPQHALRRDCDAARRELQRGGFQIRPELAHPGFGHIAGAADFFHGGAVMIQQDSGQDLAGAARGSFGAAREPAGFRAIASNRREGHQGRNLKDRAALGGGGRLQFFPASPQRVAA